MIKRFAIGILAITGLAAPFLAGVPSAHAAAPCPAKQAPVGTITFAPETSAGTWSASTKTVALCSGVAVPLGKVRYGAKVVSLTVAAGHRVRLNAPVRFRPVTPEVHANGNVAPKIVGSSAFQDVPAGAMAVMSGTFTTADIATAR